MDMGAGRTGLDGHGCGKDWMDMENAGAGLAVVKDGMDRMGDRVDTGQGRGASRGCG